MFLNVGTSSIFTHTNLEVVESALAGVAVATVHPGKLDVLLQVFNLVVHSGKGVTANLTGMVIPEMR